MRGGICFLCAALAFYSAGCTRAPSGAPAAPKAAAALSPKQTLAKLIAARQSQEYPKMEALIIAPHAQDVVETLLAVDDFGAANRHLCDYVRNEIALGLAETIDQSYLVENLDIFSAYVELLDETVTEDTAVVAFLVDGKLPAKQARLRRLDGLWRYDPGPGYSDQLPAAFRSMAHGLRQVLGEMQSGRLSAQELRNDRQRLINEVAVRLRPGVKLLPQAPDKAKPDGE